MIDRLTEAWMGLVAIYVRTSIQPPGGPVSAVLWGESDIHLLVAHLLMSSPDGALRVHQGVVGFEGFDPVDLVVTDPAPWLLGQRAPWSRFTCAAPVDLAVEVKVVSHPSDLEFVAEAATKLQAIHRAGLATDVALCVLDKTSPPDRSFYAKLKEPGTVRLLCAFDEDLPRVPPAHGGAGAPPPT